MKNKITALILLLGIAFLLTFSGCDQKGQPAMGIEDEILVFADSTEYFELEPVLEQVLGKVIYTPQPEKLFNLERRDIRYINKYKRRKNLLLLAPINSGSQTSKYVTAMLDSSVIGMVESGKQQVFNKYNLWAKNQLVMILTANSTEELGKKILENHQDILYYFQKISDKRLSEKLYSPVYEKKDIQGKLLKEYGWIMYVQIDFHLAKDVPEDNFVWLRRAPGSDMERWISVHWIDNATPEYLNKDSILAVRNRITEKFYRTSDEKTWVEVADVFKTTEVNFHDRYALYTQGLWRFTDRSGGGPFVSYTFYDEKTHRVYFLDGSLYAPKYYKKKLIQQVDVMLQSFRADYELKPDRKEELLDALED